MDCSNFWGSIIGGLISGSLTLIGVVATIKYEEKKRKKDNLKMANINKPRLEISNYFSETSSSRINVQDSKINVLLLFIQDFNLNGGHINFIYDEKYNDISNLKCVEYVFKNIGPSEIVSMEFFLNYQKEMTLSELEYRESLFNFNEINDSVFYRVNIKPNETVRVRFFYMEDQKEFYRLNVTMFLKSYEGRVSSQFIRVPENEMRDARLVQNNILLEHSNYDQLVNYFTSKFKRNVK